MNKKKLYIYIAAIVVALIACGGGLYYYFFVKLDSSWVFWRNSGEKISWDDIDYDDDFFPSDETEVYGQFSEWSFKKFKPVYAGYGTTSDGLNYLIGKYLDEDGRERRTYILVSGDGIVDYPYADTDHLTFYNEYFKNKVAVRDNETELTEPEDGFTYDEEDTFRLISSDYSFQCPDFVWLTEDEVDEYVDMKDGDNYSGSFVSNKNYSTYCNSYSMFYTNGYISILQSFDDVVSKLETGDQFSVTYLETDLSFEDCKYEYEYSQKIMCSIQSLNETYDSYMVGIYIELE